MNHPNYGQYLFFMQPEGELSCNNKFSHGFFQYYSGAILFINLNHKIMISLKFLKRKNPNDLSAPEKFYAAVINNGSIDMNKLAERIAYQSTLTPGDCYNVLSALENNVIDELKEGRIVRLGELGTFRLSVSSNGSDTYEEGHTGLVKKARILFRPGTGFRNMLKNLVFKKISFS